MLTHYDPLPLHEQIVRKKPLPTWWDKPIKWNNTNDEPIIIKSDPRWSQLPIAQGIPICLRESGPLTVLGIAHITGYKMHSIYNTIYKLSCKKIVGCVGEKGKNGRKLWCIFDGTEPFELTDIVYVGQRTGLSQCFRAALKGSPWKTSTEIAKIVDAEPVTIRDTINRLMKTGELVRRKIPAPIGHARFEYAIAEDVNSP